MFIPDIIPRNILIVFCAGCSIPLSGWAAQDPLRVDLGNGAKLELAEIAPGTFTQGSDAKEAGHRPDEVQREVRLTKKFYLGKYPVTRGQFAEFVKESGYRTEAERGESGGFGWTGAGLVQRKDFTWKNPGFAQTDEHPVTLVTYGDTTAFFAWLSKKSGRKFELPSEAQWEYACRAGTATAWYNGSKPETSDEISWNKVTAGDGTRPVGKKRLNDWGFADMSGNVWEWCADWYAPYASGPATDPVQTNSQLSDKPRRVLRGGSWMRDRMECRSASRYRNDPGSRNADNGFRVMTFDVGRGSGLLLEDASIKPASQRGGDALAAVGRQHVEAGFGFLVIMIAAIVVFNLVRNLLRLGSSFGGNGMASGGRYFTRIADDGFWITGQNAVRGTPLLCRYTVGGTETETEVVYEPGPEGQFIYTGQRPSNVSVITASQVSPPIRNYGQPRTYTDSFIDVPSSSSTSSSSSNHPPAY